MHAGNATTDEHIERAQWAFAQAYYRWAATQSESDFEYLLDTLYEQWEWLRLAAGGAGFVADELQARFPFLADEPDFWSAVNALVEGDSDLPQDEPPATSKTYRGLRAVVVFLLIFALLAYFIVPFGGISRIVQFQRQLPIRKLRPIPLSPKHESPFRGVSSTTTRVLTRA